MCFCTLESIKRLKWRITLFHGFKACKAAQKTMLFCGFTWLYRAFNGVYCVFICWNRFQLLQGIVGRLKSVFVFCDRFRNVVRKYAISILMALQCFLRLYRFLRYIYTLKRKSAIQGKLDTLQSILKHGAMIVRYPGIIPESVQYLLKFSENLGSQFFRNGFSGKNPIVNFQIFDRKFLSEF